LQKRRKLIGHRPQQKAWKKKTRKKRKADASSNKPAKLSNQKREARILSRLPRHQSKRETPVLQKKSTFAQTATNSHPKGQGIAPSHRKKSVKEETSLTLSMKSSTRRDDGTQIKSRKKLAKKGRESMEGPSDRASQRPAFQLIRGRNNHNSQRKNAIPLKKKTRRDN